MFDVTGCSWSYFVSGHLCRL